jgi:predicted RNA-binding protein YlqC (UPF0109 family)
MEQEAVDYLFGIVAPLTKNPKQIEIRHHMDDAGRGIVLNVIAEDRDLALLIGKGGLTARCIRQVMRCWCEVNQARVLLHIGEPIKIHEENF